jgi:hypothetical protein
VSQFQQKATSVAQGVKSSGCGGRRLQALADETDWRRCPLGSHDRVEDRWERRDDEVESLWLDWRTPARVMVFRARVIG